MSDELTDNETTVGELTVVGYTDDELTESELSRIQINDDELTEDKLIKIMTDFELTDKATDEELIINEHASLFGCNNTELVIIKFIDRRLLSQKSPKLPIISLPKETDFVSGKMKNNNKGLKFSKINNDQIIVEFNEKPKVEHFTESNNGEELMLHNFENMEIFCQRFGKGDDVDGNDNIVSRSYLLVKNFSDEKVHIPGKEAQIYSISKDFQPKYIFSVYANGNNYEHKGYVYINITKVKKSNRQTKGTVLFISVIDNAGNDRFTQTEIFYKKHGGGIYNINEFSLCKFMSRETVLCNPHELLHGKDLVLCITIARDMPPHITEIETKINCSFKKQRDGMHVLFLDSDVGKVLWTNSNFFQNNLENKFLSIPKVEGFKNICRLLLGASYIKAYDYEDIYDLYKVSHQYEIVAVVEFCRRLFEKHVLYGNNIRFILELAETYNDVLLSEIIANSLKFHTKYEIFICSLKNYACVRQGNQTDDLRSEHIHYARGEYIQCDNLLRNTNYQYCSFTAKYEEIETKFNFSSVFNASENEEITLPLDSDFGRYLSEISNVIKDMLKFTCSDSEPFSIPQYHLEALKNIYRLFMGANYIKATTISDIISLYEVCDFYDIPHVMEICRNLFKKHICIINDVPLFNLSKRFSDDTKLKKIVSDFKTDYERYFDDEECYPEWLNIDNFVELDEILEFQHNFHVYE